MYLYAVVSSKSTTQRKNDTLKKGGGGHEERYQSEKNTVLPINVPIKVFLQQLHVVLLRLRVICSICLGI